jgi:hypothetical protein
MDIWKAAGPQIDFLSPDFIAWNTKYAQPGNPLFIPEARLGAENGAQAFYSIGQFNAIGFSPFSIESSENPGSNGLSKSYRILAQLTPLILEKQAENATAGVYVDRENTTQTVTVGEYILTVSHDYTLGWAPQAKEPGPWPIAGGIIIRTGPGEFYVAGEGLVLTAVSTKKDAPVAGFASIYEEEFADGVWKAGRLMNGD